MGVALGLLGALFLGGSAYLSPARLAKSIDRDLRARLGAIRELHVYVRGPHGIPVMKGRFHSVDVRIAGFNADHATIPTIQASSEPSQKTALIRSIHVDARDFIYDGVRIDRAEVFLIGLRYDTEAARRKEVRLVELESGTLEVRVSESELRARALERLTGVVEPQFRFVQDRVMVSGIHKVTFVPVPFSLSGHLSVRRGREVHLTDTDMRVSVLAVPDVLENLLLSELNPVYTFKTTNQLPFEVEVDRVSIEGSELITRGRIVLSRTGASQRDFAETP